ncbi:MAG: AraC family transcriptional regulator [Ruminococcaceae bacterium]|nr:AraC family transcriptional regulator [Oscillospiraceae bacterium]
MYSNALHRHPYAEIHILAKGSVALWIDNQEYVMKAGDILLIPPNVYHSISICESDILHSAFQLNENCKEIIRGTMPLEMLLELFNEIRLPETENNYLKITSYLLLICSNLIESFSVKIPIVTDDAFLISEFFNSRYFEDVYVSDLAWELHISERQAQALVKRHTGRTFRQELTLRRMQVAQYLMNHTGMSKNEVAEKVGFHSYSGFWKVYKLYEENPELFKKPEYADEIEFN